MRASGRNSACGAFIGVLLLLVAAPGVGQEQARGPESAAQEHEPAEHEFHRNHFGGSIGGSTHLDNEETGLTLGLEYARQFSRRWAAAAYTEMVSSNAERDFILIVAGVFYPTHGLGLVVGPGVEFVDKDVESHGMVEQESEVEFLLRLGAGYGFELTPQAALGPVLFADWAGNRWTLVYGVAWCCNGGRLLARVAQESGRSNSTPVIFSDACQSLFATAPSLAISFGSFRVG
jgi:hypothetical protein